jgi:hypothetical protein
MNEYSERLRALLVTQQSQLKAPSKHVINLAQQINEWHENRQVPERWQPVMLGRIAALFGVSRELAAAALQYAEWKETRKSTTSLWLPTTNLSPRRN